MPSLSSVLPSLTFHCFSLFISVLTKLMGVVVVVFFFLYSDQLLKPAIVFIFHSPIRMENG